MRDLRQIFLEEDILPLGDFEALKIACLLDGESKSYPPVVELGRVAHHSELVREAYAHLPTIGRNFILERANHFTAGIARETVVEILERVGFTKASYQSFSLRKLGTSELEHFVEPRTRNFFETFGCKTFRMQYTIAQPGWRIKFHTDHENFRRHGFRAMAPMDSVVLISFLVDGKEKVFQLKPGFLYFVNIARLHRAFNPFSAPRLNLAFQMASDELILQGQEVAPLTEAQSLTEYESYLSTEIMEDWTSQHAQTE